MICDRCRTTTGSLNLINEKHSLNEFRMEMGLSPVHRVCDKCNMTCIGMPGLLKSYKKSKAPIAICANCEKNTNCKKYMMPPDSAAEAATGILYPTMLCEKCEPLPIKVVKK